MSEPQYKQGDIVKGNIKVLKNGAGYDLDRGRIAHAPNTFPTGYDTSITSESASELANVRHTRRRQAVEDALANAHPEFHTDYDGLRLIFDNQVILASDPDAGRASTEATKLIMRMGDYADDTTKQAIQVNVQVNVVPGLMDEEEW